MAKSHLTELSASFATRRFSCLGILLVVACLSPPVIGRAAEIEFSRDIRPILSDRCFICHGPDSVQRVSELRLDLAESAYEFAIQPGDAAASELIERLRSTDGDIRMPPADSHLELTESEIQLLVDWIDQGAKYSGHWAFAAPTKSALPLVHDVAWPRDEIDRFVLAKLDSAGLSHNGPANRPTMLRRLSLDLTGLPPTRLELVEFQLDARPDAYERVVDELLARPSFGERWAVDWLDVARYADTYGYQNDKYRAMWPWRDWVVSALNENLPYDQFIRWQIAGDLLPDATESQILATAFNRNHRQTNEGGSVEEEFRQEYVADRVNTFGAAFLGLTLECCRCHDHKYDPLSQRDYYSLAAFFNSIDESGLYSHFTNAVPTPALDLVDVSQASALAVAVLAIRAEEGKFRDWRDAASVKGRPSESSIEGKPTGMAPRIAELLSQSTQRGLLGHFALEAAEGDALLNSVAGQADGQKHDGPQEIPGRIGGGLQLDGENHLRFSAGRDFSRDDPFSISFWLNVPESYRRAVVLHRSRAWTDAGSRGYELLIEDGKLSFALVHFWPGNALRVVAAEPVSIGVWTQVTLTYDGSSRAGGMQIYVDGRRVELTVIRDALTRKILADDGSGGGEGDRLTFGSRFRDVGLKDGMLDEIRVYDRELCGLEARYLFAPSFADDAASGGDVASDTAEYMLGERPEWSVYQAELRRLRKVRSQLVNPTASIMVMRELAQPRETHLLMRGAYDSPGELVSRTTPQAIMKWALPENPSRRDLADWLLDPRHPLTSRVVVNRFWQTLFGVGLVATSEDFGTQGSPPSHRRLLDWLAVDFVQSGWDTKRLIKRIVMSSTYRQDSDPNAELLAKDPENRLLARGPVQRLSAEMIRDSALSSGGLLVTRVGGAAVKPYQPAGLWKEKSGTVYQRDRLAGSWRRSVYTYWKRTSPPPSMMTFDASSREVCTVRRQQTATPLQTLVLLNDPQYVEAARALADAVLLSGADSSGQLKAVFHRLTSRLPSESELTILRRIYDQQLDAFRLGPKERDALLAIGDYVAQYKSDPAALAALAVVAQGLFTYDEVLMKR